MKGRRAKSKSAHHPPITFHQITQLRTDQWRIAAGMLPDDQIIPQTVERVWMAAEQIKMKAWDLGGLSRDFGQSGRRWPEARSRCAGWVRRGPSDQHNSSRLGDFLKATFALAIAARPSGDPQARCWQRMRAKAFLDSAGCWRSSRFK